jgi:hypothetical protein
MKNYQYHAMVLNHTYHLYGGVTTIFYRDGHHFAPIIVLLPSPGVAFPVICQKNINGNSDSQIQWLLSILVKALVAVSPLWWPFTVRASTWLSPQFRNRTPN